MMEVIMYILDYKAGFGGSYGVQSDRVDKSAVGWEHKEELTKHDSQKGKYKGYDVKCPWAKNDSRFLSMVDSEITNSMKSN